MIEFQGNVVAALKSLSPAELEAVFSQLQEAKLSTILSLPANEVANLQVELKYLATLANIFKHNQQRSLNR